MSYPKKVYDSVFQEVSKITKKSYPPLGKYVQCMVGLKRIFDEGFTLQEIDTQMMSAFEKRKWPGGTPLMTRLHNCLVVMRKEQKEHGWSAAKVDHGPESLADIFKKRAVHN